MKFIQTAAVAALLTISAATASAATMPTTVTVGSMPHEFFGNYSIDYMIGSYYGATDWPSFTTSLSSQSTLTFKLKAPDGMQFQYIPKASSIGANMFVGTTTWASNGANLAGIRPTLPSMVVVDGLQGRAFDASSVLAKIGQDKKTEVCT